MGVFDRLERESEALTAANPQGINAYDKGKSFEEATGGVERDASGKFAPESGSHSGRFKGKYSNTSDRASRRRASMERSRKQRAEKDTKKGDAETKKRQRESDRAKKAAQDQELANISLQISEASAAGDTIKAAELRVVRAEKVLQFADTQIERTRAQTTLNNAKAALARARVAASRKQQTKTTTSTTSTESGSGGTITEVTGPHAKGLPYDPQEDKKTS